MPGESPLAPTQSFQLATPAGAPGGHRGPAGRDVSGGHGPTEAKVAGPSDRSLPAERSPHDGAARGATKRAREKETGASRSPP